jgi:tol-pal system protein YbgF
LRKSARIVLLAAGLWALAAQPVFGVSREIIRIMQQLDTMQQTIQNMQKTLDTQTAVLRTLVEQVNDNVNSMKLTVAELQKSSGRNLAATNARFDSLTSEIQALSASLDESKARLAKLSDQVMQTQNIIQTLNAPPPAATAATPGAPGATPAPASTPPPDPDTLYKSGLTYLNGGQYPLAIQAFQQFLKNYGTSDLASNAQFFIGESYYSQGDFNRAIAEYNKCLERYPNGSKLPAAQLKKSYALIQLGKKTAAERELHSLITRYPHSREADLARQRLARLRKEQ